MLYLAACGWGVVASFVFPPVGFSHLAWVVFIPLLWVASRLRYRIWGIGYCFGFAYFAANLWWLRTVFSPAPFFISGLCAFYPALWLVISHRLLRNLALSDASLHPLYEQNPPDSIPLLRLSRAKQCLLAFLLAFLWCGLEWVRSWFLSGFPWNLFGVSQWQTMWLLPVCRYTGVYGISFLLLFVNVAIFFFIQDAWLNKQWRLPWPLFISLILLIAAGLSRYAYVLPRPDRSIKVALIQGNLPLMRRYTDEQLTMAIKVYTSLTEDVVERKRPDLVVWPESAVPAPLLWNEECRQALTKLFTKIKTALLVGSIDYRMAPVKTKTSDYQSYNSALFFDRNGQLINTYDKIRIVPFGEFVPMSEYFPWLVDWIDIGRNLDAGREYTLFPFQEGAVIGMNICYEDIFPDISRRMVQGGATVLCTITNDAWYLQSAGSWQHLTHAVFRAVETLRPMLRSGNNSDSCLIYPDGRLVNELKDSTSGSRFVRKAGIYEVPIWPVLPKTFYTKYGDCFAYFSFIISLAAILWCSYRALQDKQKLYKIIKPEETTIPY